MFPSESELDGDHLVLPIILTTSSSPVHTYALIDSGTSANAFIDGTFARRHGLQPTKLTESRIVRTVDGTSSSIYALCSHLDDYFRSSREHLHVSVYLGALSGDSRH